VDRTSWWSPRAIGLHVTVLVVVPGCIALCWWQVDRALSGNDLSWAYVFEWPFFAGYAAFLWWRLVHERPAVPGRAAPSAPVPPGPVGNGVGPGTSTTAVPRDAGTEAHAGADADADAELAAYNRHLAALEADGRPKRW
jgi:hypothetical protein